LKTNKQTTELKVINFTGIVSLPFPKYTDLIVITGYIIHWGCGGIRNTSSDSGGRPV
jgi:hypothetical protein